MSQSSVCQVVAITLLMILAVGCDDQAPSKSTSNSQSGQAPTPPPQCDAESTITGNKHYVVGSEISVRKGPGANYEKIINQKATRVLKTKQFIHIDESVVVFEECTKGDWSYIRVLEPDWLQKSHRGWVQGKFIDKGQQDSVGDPYKRKIGSVALDPYTKTGYPKTVKKYGSRLPEIESMRRKAAEMSIDSGKCDFVELVELSDKKSTLDHLEFWVDCRNGQRIYLDENQLSTRAQVKTEAEKAWSKENTMNACKQGIKDRALLPSEVKFHEILGTSFYEAPQTHNVVLTMDFEVTNAFGTEIEYTAKCHFAPGELGEINVSVRD